MSAKKHEIISAGRSEAARMRNAVAQAASDAQVTMNARQFATLARLIESLCEVGLETVGGSMGDPRYWVPLEEYAKLKRERAELLAARQTSFDTLLGGWPSTLDLQNAHLASHAQA